jgi:hypothetical protein
LPEFGLQREADAVQLATMREQLQGLKRELEQSQLMQRVGAARGAELERQIDSLNHALRESRQELSFYRNARPSSP